MAGSKKIKTKYKKIVSGLHAYFKKNGLKKAVVGLSGGVDSALVVTLAVHAIGKENVSALLLPELGLTRGQNIQDAKEYAEQLGIEYFVQPINKMVESLEGAKWPLTDVAKGNLRARCRAILLYSFANSQGAIVLGTGNKTELYMGYFTKYGDGAVDLLPIADLWKHEVREMASMLGVPEKIVEKVPTAELWHGQTDEGELGITYGELDKILEQLIDKKIKPKQLCKKFGKETIEKILKTIKSTEHKRRMPPVLKSK